MGEREKSLLPRSVGVTQLVEDLTTYCEFNSLILATICQWEKMKEKKKTFTTLSYDSWIEHPTTQLEFKGSYPTFIFEEV
jgi:hypothetical protein